MVETGVNREFHRSNTRVVDQVVEAPVRLSHVREKRSHRGLVTAVDGVMCVIIEVRIGFCPTAANHVMHRSAVAFRKEFANPSAGSSYQGYGFLHQGLDMMASA